MSAIKKMVPHATSILTMVDELIAAGHPGAFTRGQLIAAVIKCRAACPGIEISDLFPQKCADVFDTKHWDETVFSGHLPSKQAHALIDAAALPKPPKRIFHDYAKRSVTPFRDVERRRGLIHFVAYVRDGDRSDGLVAHLSPSQIRAAAPEVPESERAWRTIVDRRLRDALSLPHHMIKAALLRPVHPSSMPSEGRAREAAYIASNAHFCLRQQDVERLAALCDRRLHELQEELFAVLDETRLCGPGTVARMNLVVNNTPEKVQT